VKLEKYLPWLWLSGTWHDALQFGSRYQQLGEPLFNSVFSIWSFWGLNLCTYSISQSLPFRQLLCCCRIRMHLKALGITDMNWWAMIKIQ
jgi:hypothetical protein